MATDHPEPHQVPRYLGRFSCTAAFDEPRQCAAIVLEIVTHAIQPFGLSGSDQPVGGEGRFSDAIASEPFECVVALARRGELEAGVRPHGFEHLEEWSGLR